MATTPQAPAPNYCVTCNYYMPIPDNTTRGTCHRYPPPEGGNESNWPIVVGDTDWCGEHQ